MLTPNVSVIIPTYNRANYVAEAITSALAQTQPPREVIVVDDGSTDDTANALAGFGDRIQVITQSNGGSSAARNAALSVAQGEFVAWLDSDDVWLPEKLARQLEAAHHWPDAALIHTRCYVIDAESRQRPLPADDEPEIDCLEEDALERIIHHCYPNTSSCLIRHSALDTVGGFDPSWAFAEDWELNLRLAERFPFAYVAERLTCYRIHAQSKTADGYPHALGQVRLRRHIHTRRRQWLSVRATQGMREALNIQHREYLSACIHLGKTARARGDHRVACSAFRQAVCLEPLAHKNWSRCFGMSIAALVHPPKPLTDAPAH